MGRPQPKSTDDITDMVEWEGGRSMIGLLGANKSEERNIRTITKSIAITIILHSKQQVELRLQTVFK